MQKTTIFLFIAFTSVLLSSCGNEERKGSEIPEEKPEVIQEYTNDTIYFSDNYPEFTGNISGILDSLKFCEITPDETLPDSLQLYPCNAEFFGIFPNSSSGSWKNGFLMEARQGVWAKSSRVFNIEKGEFGYTVTNDMKGQLLYMLPNKSGKHKIVMRYYDSQVGTIGVEHEWKGASYKPIKVVLINDYPIKAEYQDSLNHYYLDNFVWGF